MVERKVGRLRCFLSWPFVCSACFIFQVDFYRARAPLQSFWHLTCASQRTPATLWPAWPGLAWPSSGVVRHTPGIRNTLMPNHVRKHGHPVCFFPLSLPLFPLISPGALARINPTSKEIRSALTKLGNGVLSQPGCQF